MIQHNFTPFPILQTQRLTLRQLLSSDDNEIFALRSDKSVNEYLDRKPANTIEDARSFISAIHEGMQHNNSIYWAIAWNDGGKLLGTVCLFDISHDELKAEIGYELLPGFQGKGIMHEAIAAVIDFAFNHIGLQSIEACIHAENAPSTRLLEKMNFKKQGTAGDNLIILKLTNSIQ